MPFDHPQIPWYIRLRRVPVRFAQRLAEWGTWLVWPIEQAIALVAHVAFAITERFEGLEWFGLRLAHFLLWPFRWLGRVADRLIPASVRSVLVAPFHWLSAAGFWLVHMMMQLAERLNLDGAIWWLVRWTRPVWYPLAAVGGFFHAWFITRRYKQLLWGLPVVLILLPIVAVAAWTKLWGHGTIAANYRLAVQQALEDKDYRRVQLYERKLARMGVDSRFTDFKTACALGDDGKTAEAYERMQELAPVDEPGFPPAHLWIVKHLLEEKLPVSKEDGHRLMGVHLDHLDTFGVRAPEVQLLRALWLVRSNEFAKAADLLLPLVNRMPAAAAMRMEMDISLQRIDEARSDARAVRSHMQDRIRRGHPLVAQEYQSWTVAEELLGNVDQQEVAVRAWLKLEPNNREAQRILSVLCRKQFETKIAQADANPEELAGLFLEAAELADDPQILQQQIGLLYYHRERVPVAKRVVELVANSPRAQAVILEAAGTAAAKAGEMAQAKSYLEQAIKKDPRNAIAWNNYAFILSREANPDLERALAAVTKALEIMPNEYQFRETRGHVLVQLGRWEEAIPDLEFAINGLPTSPEIHQALAKAYDAIGEKQLARAHAQQAQ